MRDIRILSDFRLSQIPLWKNRTHYIGNIKLVNVNKNDKAVVASSAWLSAFIDLSKILKNIKNYDILIQSNIRTAQLFGLFRSISRIKYPKQIVLELMLDEEQDTLAWKIKRAIQRFIFSYVDIVFVSSTHEIDVYSKRMNRPGKHFKFLPFHTNIMEPRITKRGNYILSAGRTCRNYGVLADAVKDLDVEVVIVGDEHSVKGIHFPPNVTVMVEVPYSKYLDLLYNCRLVVVPLKKVVKSTGQVVFLEAMATGKPVIATETVGTKDYIQSGVNGILVPPDNPISLREAINTVMKNPELENNISTNALESVKKLYTLEKYCSTILNVAEELYKD
jgi:glycosyltransferase involved in cell wall biosynthesis